MTLLAILTPAALLLGLWAAVQLRRKRRLLG
jgi:hypothetical protein